MSAYGVPYQNTPSSIAEEMDVLGDEEDVLECPDGLSDGDEHEDEEEEDILYDESVVGDDDAASAVAHGRDGMDVDQQGGGNTVWVHRQGRGGQVLPKKHNPAPTEPDAGMHGQVVASGAGSSSSAARNYNNITDDDDSESDGTQNADPQLAMQMIDASVMPGFEFKHLGKNITPRVPCFRQGVASNPTWMPYGEVVVSSIDNRPCRAEVMHLPASLFARDGTRFRHWCTPSQNTLRANQMAALCSMFFAPTSKGFL